MHVDGFDAAPGNHHLRVLGPLLRLPRQANGTVGQMGQEVSTRRHARQSS
jgi:hypothetical protein